VVSSLQSEAEAGGREHPFRVATLICRQHGPGEHARAFRARGELLIELPGYYDGVLLDKFVPFSGTEWQTNAKRFIR
jgi:hypothetical protein